MLISCLLVFFSSKCVDITKFQIWNELDIQTTICQKKTVQTVYTSTVGDKWSALFTRQCQFSSFLCDSHHSYVRFLGDKELYMFWFSLAVNAVACKYEFASLFVNKPGEKWDGENEM